MSELNDDLLDEGLQNVMGKDRCQNDWYPKWKESKQTKQDTPADASCAPAKTPTYLDKIRNCAKYGLIFGAASGLLFYWQQSGLLASRAAVPSLIFCALGAGLTIGWHAR